LQSGSEYVDTLNFNDGWTVEATFKFNSFTNYGVAARPGIVCKEGDNDGYPFFEVQIEATPGANYGNLRVTTSRTSPSNRRFYGATVIETGKWYSIAVTYDRNAGDSERQVNLYIKGETDSEYKFDGTSGGPWSNITFDGNEPWSVGRGVRTGFPKGFLDGIVDEVRISDESLTSTYFLASVTTGPEPPVFKNVNNSPLEPSDTDMVEIAARVTAVNSTVTNVTFEYSVNGGGYLGPFQMTATDFNEYTGTIISQSVDSVISFRLTAVNSAGETTTTGDFVYAIYEAIPWETVVATSDSIAGGWNISGMAVAPNGLAGFAYRSAADNKARYIEETSLGVMGSAVEISTDSQGFNAGIVFGTNGEPRITLSYDQDDTGGLTFVQRTNGAWTTPMMIVTNEYNEIRNVITIGPNQMPSVLWYSDGRDFGELVDVTSVDSFSDTEVLSPPFPVNVASKSIDECRRPFGMLFGTDNKRRIVLSGRGVDEKLCFGIEDSVGGGVDNFSWTELSPSNIYVDQMGFALDENNNAYIACRDLSTTPTTAVLFENSSGPWNKHTLGPMGHWGHCIIAVNPDPDNSFPVVWIAHNIAGEDTTEGFKLWSNRADQNVWKKEQSITNGIYIDSLAGFGITEFGTMKIAFKPDVSSTDLVYMYCTKFGVPEPGIILSILFSVFGIFIVRKKL